MEVMREVRDWVRVAQGNKDMYGAGNPPLHPCGFDLDVPDSKMPEVKYQLSSERDRIHDIVEYWVNTSPRASWEQLGRALYVAKEDRALAMLRQYCAEGIYACAFLDYT